MKQPDRHGTAFDVLVVGGGHAGCEAAAAAARRGCSVALIAIDAAAIGSMSCNPAIGGVGKGHLVREVDVFDGLIASAADEAAIHYRMLNASKGAAVHGPRVQADRGLFRAAIQRRLRRHANLRVIEGEVVSLHVTGGTIEGVTLADGTRLTGQAVILASGTFLGGKLFRGRERFDGGRIGEPGAHRLARQIRDLGFAVARLKTGTPPRIDGRSIDWSRIERQRSDDEPWRMSEDAAGPRPPQVFCGITRTTAETHDLIRDGFADSPLFSGDIGGRGPRYCPSIEDKVKRFGDRDGHQIFLEPETLDGTMIYPNGISTSLSVEVQQRFVRSIPALESAIIATPGYAVEYDHVDPRTLSTSLASRDLTGLFLAGQINGTTGYEEAAAQGLVAGLAAAASCHEEDPPAFDRASSYIGVMVDDLTLQGVTEPYRMMTARAEHRLHLRADNAEARLGDAAMASRALSPTKRSTLAARATEREKGRAVLRAQPQGRRDDRHDGALWEGIRDSIRRELFVDEHYAPYVERQRAEAARLRTSDMPIAADFDYAAIPGLSSEMIERLSVSRPDSIAQASRIQGVTPAALTALLVAARAA